VTTSDSEPGTRRDLAADLACVLVSAAGGLVLLITRLGAPAPSWVSGSAGVAFAVDAALGAIACGLLWFRRRWPAGVAIAMLPTLVLSRSAQVANVLSVYNVSLRRRPRIALTVACLHQLAFVGYILLWTVHYYPLWAAFLWVLVYHIAAVALGMYARARRQLIASLHERVQHAEATQKLLAEQARHAERARIATEMHDVLGHRVSLMALQAGALEIRPDLPPDEVRATAGLIRSTARQALAELRDVIGVLHEGDGRAAPRAPQPALSDIGRLVGEYRQAGLDVRLDMQVATPEAAPGPVGRDTYRIVREALTNVSKHAGGTAAIVSVSGGPGEGLQVVVRNPMPPARPLASGQASPRQPALPDQPARPGAGMGLAGLAERVALAGGTLSHGPEPGDPGAPDGDFVLTAALRWDN
jgi:signal transduction histidine kinase